MKRKTKRITHRKKTQEIKYHHVLIVLGALLLGFFIYLYSNTSSNVQRSSAQTPKPNIVVIMTDDQSDKPHMLDQMPITTSLIGNQGTAFANSFVITSLCCPSRSTFLTGLYTHNTKVWSNNGTDGGYAVFNQYNRTQNLPIWLKNSGYTTALVGKYLNGYGPKSTVIPAGWSEWYALDNGGAEGEYYNYYMNENGAIKFYGTGDANYNTDVLTRKAVNFVNKHAADTKPYFMFVAYSAPHGDPDAANSAVPATRDIGKFANEPLPQPPSFNEADMSDKNSIIAALPLLTDQDITDITTNYRKRLEALQAVDLGVQYIYNALQSTGKLNNTIIIFTSDNGFEQGEHRIKKAKGYPYEESARVPLLIKGPGVPVGTVNRIVANLDLAPTIIDLAGATAGIQMDGRSLVPLYQNPTTTPWRDRLLIEGISKQYFTLIMGNTFYTHAYNNQIESYDLSIDPFQLNASNVPDPVIENAINSLNTCLGTACNSISTLPQ